MFRFIDRSVTSLAGKLIIGIGLLIVLSVSILLYGLITSGENILLNNAVRQTALYSDIIKKSIDYDMLTLHRDAIQHTVMRIGSNPNIKKINIFDKKGKIFFSSEPREIGQFVDRSSNSCLGCHADPLKPSETLKSGKPWTIYEGKDGHRRLTYVEPIYNEPSCYNSSCHFHPENQKTLGILQTDFSLFSVDNDIRRQTINIAIYALVFICITSIFLFLFLRNFVNKPVSLLAKAMRQIAGGNTSERINIDSSDELGTLAAAFNTMLENLHKTTVSRDLLVKEVKEHKEVQEQLVKSERFLNMIFESIQEPFMIVDRDYRIVRANDAYVRLRDIPVIELFDEKCHKIIYGKDGICDKCIVEKTFRSSDPFSMDKMILLADGTEAWFDYYTYPITDEQGQVSHVIEYLQDITHRKRAERAAKNAYIEMEQIFNTAADGMCVIDKNFKIARVNKTLLGMFGISKANVVGRSCYEIFPDDQCNTPACPLSRILGGEDNLIQFESVKKRKDGTPLCLIVTSTAFRGADGELLGIVQDFKDISERKRLEEELRALSLKDELTGLYNRRGFITLAERELKMAVRLKRGIYMLFADMDGLKSINDTLGHNEGDKAIIETAIVLKETFRSSDIVGRIGGDEFVTIPIGIAGDNIDLIVGRLQKNLDKQNSKIDRSYQLSLSVGVAFYDPASNETIDELLVRADALMYEQKKNKRKV